MKRKPKNNQIETADYCPSTASPISAAGGRSSAEYRTTVRTCGKRRFATSAGNAAPPMGRVADSSPADRKTDPAHPPLKV